MTPPFAKLSQRRPLRLLFALAWLLLTASARAQISLSTTVNLALQNNPRVKIAETDLRRAKAVLAETRDVFIPSVSATAGVGRATGAPLSPPVVFSIGAQSLVYSFSQPDYIRAAHSGVSSAQLALEVARTDVAEDATGIYVALDNTLERRRVLGEALAIAGRLVTIVEDRYNAGIDPHIEVTRARRTAAQIRLQALAADDEAAANAEHLASLTGLPAAGWITVPSSIPKLESPKAVNREARDDPAKNEGTTAAFETARARQYTAHGEARYLFRPQLSFSVQYSKLSDAFTTYDLYYPGFRDQISCNPVCAANGRLNSFNSLSLGVQLTLPLLDMVHRARAHEAAIDAQRSFLDAEVQQSAFLENRTKLMHNTEEIAARVELATLDHDLSQDQLNALAVRLQAAASTVGGEQATPKDQENAQLAERQRTVDLLAVQLELRRAEISLLRQGGSLANWLAATIPGATAAPADATAAPADATPSQVPGLPTTLGSSPGASPGFSPGAAPGTSAGTGAGAGTTPTTGSTPSSLPSAPDSRPAPAMPTPPSVPAPAPAPAPPAAPPSTPRS